MADAAKCSLADISRDLHENARESDFKLTRNSNFLSFGTIAISGG